MNSIGSGPVFSCVWFGLFNSKSCSPYWYKSKITFIFHDRASLSFILPLPFFLPIKIAEQKDTIRFELESLDFRPDVEPELTDLIHAVGNFTIFILT